MAYASIITDRQKEHFSNCYDVDAKSGCWLWNRKARHSFGYGLASIGSYTNGNHKQVTAHRLSYELHHGPVPDGMLVCHKCDVPGCVNPDHLYAGTYKDNMRDAAERNRCHRVKWPKGERHPTARLSDADVETIRTSAEKNTVLAERYGVHRQYISRIKHCHERA